MFRKQCIHEQVVTTSKPSYARVYLENILFEEAGFGIGQKFTYYLDFKNKKVTIVPLKEDKALKYKGSMTRRMKKQYVPVLNIQSKDIEKVFAGINKCKIKIFKNEIIVQRLDDDNENENMQSSTNIEECNENNLLDYNDYINEKIINREEIDVTKPLIRISKAELYKFYNENDLGKEKLDNIFEFNSDPFTQEAKELPEVKEDTPILKKVIRALSLFSGIGAFEKALDDNNINYELVNYCEIDKHASKAYSAIHNVSEDLNLWDITKINVKKLIEKAINLITHASPCQDASSCGLQRGLDENSGTRSSLLWKSVEIIEAVRPKFVIWENVKNVLSSRHSHNVEKYMDRLKSCGYTSYCKVLDSKEQGIPHSRSRVFIVSILGEHKPFVFPDKIPLTKSLQDFLIDSDKPAGVDPDMKPGCYKEFVKHYDNIVNCKTGIYDCKAKTDFQDKKVGIQYAPCFRAGSRSVHVLDKNKTVRNMTMREKWDLMGFGQKAYEKVKSIGISLTQMQKQIGNSIDVHVLRRIFNNLFSYC